MTTSDSNVRIDKYLWAVRIFKNRSLATEACKKGRIEVFGMTAKPSRLVKVNDLITYKTPPIVRSFKVIGILEKRQSAKIVADYLIETTPEEEFIKLKMTKEDKYIFRDKGLGRPTKRDRRQLGKIMDDDL
ncbi:MAG: RNA-binding S4 domain-containing protein [Bacteroidales bacterium]|nr:RNA-binding S4 domain-containing protein [Bacteroidales bacterium]